MAKGYPDFFGISIFSKFGPENYADGTVICTDGAWNDLISLDFKGYINDFTVQNSNSEHMADFTIRVHIGPVVIFEETVLNCFSNNNREWCREVIQARYFYGLATTYRFGLAYKLYVEEPFLLEVLNDSGANRNFTYTVRYNEVK